MRIAIVEDELRIREGITRLLEKLSPDYEVAGEACDGAEGLALIERERPDLVITDIRMPGMSGLELLERLRQMGIPFKAIVLSAYSEFAYAQRAIKLGVCEYLLKPVALDDFSASMRRIEAELAHERRAGGEKPSQLHSLESIVCGILMSGLPVDEGLGRFVDATYGLDPAGAFAAGIAYLGDGYAGAAGSALEAVKPTETAAYRLCPAFPLPANRELLLLFHGVREAELAEAYFTGEAAPEIRRVCGVPAACGWIAFDGLGRLKESVETLRRHMDWNIVTGSEGVAAYPRVLQTRTLPLPYPIELENRVKACVCDVNYAGLHEALQQFERHLRQGPYKPSEIKETAVRFLWAVLNIMKEIDFETYRRVDQQALLDRVMSARTAQELSGALLFFTGAASGKQEPKALSLPVRRAANYIREYYESGITLEEIAEKLGLTPEYLGTQFHREVGETFNAYIKNCRLKKAKELLIGTDMKLFEIASAVGYADPKYFSRVFREATGQLPAAYRKLHR